jgi:hypothetical protein
MAVLRPNTPLQSEGIRSGGFHGFDTQKAVETHCAHLKRIAQISVKSGLAPGKPSS